MTNPTNKCQAFTDLHVKEAPLVLYNVWDAGGAKALEEAGAKAVATGSWSMAAAHGYADGQNMPLDFMLGIITRIVQSVVCPVSVDFEGGFATEPSQIAENVSRLLDTGAVGLNFEDQVVGGPGLNSVADQCRRIEAIRTRSEMAGIPVFLNARTDVFLKADGTANHTELQAEALTRLDAYADAGADGFFVPGLTDPDLIAEICASAPIPVNVMMSDALPSVAAIAKLGVARASYGPFPYFKAMAAFSDAYGKALAS